MSNANRVLFLCSYLALASTSSLTALSCSEEAEESAPVTLQIRYAGESDTSSTLRKDQSVFSLAPGAANVTKFDEVARILVDITFVASGTPFYTNFELTKLSPNTWRGDVPLLPRNQQLRFAARALNSSGDEAFSGETIATLAINNQNVEIPLAPTQDNGTYPMPRMFRIVYPEQMYAGQEEQFTFTIQGNAGQAIGFRITPVGSTTTAAEFSPASGTVTLTNTVADFMTVFAAPDVAADTPLDYQITITAVGAQSTVAITTNFRTTIKPRPPGGPIVIGTRPSVLFNPVILSLNANGSATPGTIELVAAVSDDSPAAELDYQWSFTPTQGTPTATFAGGGTANPALFEGYTVEHQGTISLAVTDENNGTTTLNYTLTPDQFADAIDNGSVNGIKRIVSGAAHTCVLTGENRVRCWGDNQYGQLGYANTIDVGDSADRLPRVIGDVPLPLLDPVLQLVAGENHTCALLQSGLLYCWGRNNSGQLGYSRTDNLGDGEAITAFGFVTVGDLVTRVAAGGNHTCAILVGGAVRCWGSNSNGQLGRGDTASIGDNETVYSAGNLTFGAGVTVRDLALGGSHTCAVFTNGAARCWGNGAQGQLGHGNGNNLADNEPLANVPNVSLTGTIRKMVAGANHTCALTDVGTLRCWGYGAFGQIGQIFSHGNGNIGVNGPNWGDQANELPSTLPSDINTGASVTDVASGANHVCALSADGRLKCWGLSSSGQLGYGNTTSQGAPPANGVNLDGVTAYRISAGAAHSCALRSNGTARCWGEGDDGRLGRGNTADSFTATGNVDIQLFAAP